MDIKSLTAVVAIADHGTFGHAASALGLSVSSISLQISALEQHIGLKLFDRKTRPPTLTESGRAFVIRARKLIDDWQDLAGDFAASRTRGELRLGAVHTSVVHVLPSALKQLQKLKPGLKIRLSTGLSHELEQRVERRQLDCALISLSPAHADALQSTLLLDEPLHVVAHKTAIGNTWRKLLEANPYVRFARHAQVGRLIDAELLRQKVTVTSHMEVDTLEGVVALVRNGLGVSILPGNQQSHRLPASIRRVPFSRPVLHRKLGIIMRRDCEKSHLISDLIEALQQPA